MMRKAKLKLGRLVLLDIEGEIDSTYPPVIENEMWQDVAGAKQNKEGKPTHMFYQPCDAEQIAKDLKDDPVFEEPVHLEVWSLEGKEEIDKLYEFDGTLYDALLIASNEGAKYDI
jgi:hypothetical protein